MISVLRPPTSVRRPPSTVFRLLSSLARRSFPAKAAVLVFVLLAGCASPQPKNPIPWGPKEVDAFTKLSRPAALFGITVYAEKGGPRFKGGYRVHEGQVSELKLLGKGTAPATVIKLKPGGPGEFTALIDTSSKESWFATKGMKNSNFIPMGPPVRSITPVHVVDQIQGLLCIAPKLRFDTLEMEEILFYSRAATGPLGRLARDGTRPEPDAVLGTELLKAFSFVRIDFPRRAVFFAATREFKPEESLVIANVPMREASGAIACDGVIDGDP
ncbi:MAG TPA: hypothetical protein VIH35_07085, partial [Kiritimatiellia bacterium]